MTEQNLIKEGVGEKKKRGRRPKNQEREVKIDEEQKKFYVDLSQDESTRTLIIDLLRKCNKKAYGGLITFKELAVFAVSKITEKDIEKIQEGSLSEMEKVERALHEHNKKTGQNLGLGEFLTKKLGIN